MFSFHDPTKEVILKEIQLSDSLNIYMQTLAFENTNAQNILKTILTTSDIEEMGFTPEDYFHYIDNYMEKYVTFRYAMDTILHEYGSEFILLPDLMFDISLDTGVMTLKVKGESL